MGGPSNNPPLPAPTETESTIHTAAPTSTDLGTELGTDVSGPGDERSSYSIPEDGTPVTIKAGHRATKSQTSLLIEYFEGSKGGAPSGSSDQRKPSVRVRLTPSSGRRSKSSAGGDRIKITQTKRKTSGSSHRSAASARAEGSETLSTFTNELDDASSYASATEESNVSRNPIDIEIERGSSSSRRRRPASPLIPAADSKASYVPPPSSDISAIPTDSFLDGSGGYTTNSYKMSDLKSSKSSRDRSPTRTTDYLGAAAVGLGAAAVADKVRNREGRERVVVSRTRDKEKEKERDRDRDRRHKTSKSRTSSVSKDDNRRRPTKSHTESLVSMADSSVVSSALAPSHRSMDNQSVRSAASKASSINNPKLLETVEDAIRRLILPELNALKREQSKRGSRRGDSAASSTTTLSRDEFANDRRRSGATEKALTPRDSVKISKERRDREARNDFDDSSALSQESVEDPHDLDDTPNRSASHLKAAAAGAAIGAAAVAAHEAFNSPSDDKQRSRRRRREQRSRDQGFDGDSDLLAPPMPLMSDVNASDVTRASILSADTDRPRSASEEFDGTRDFSGSSQLSAASASTPIGNPALTLQALGTQHANVSHGDLKKLPNQRTGDLDEYVLDDSGKKVPSRHHRGQHEDDEFDDEEFPDFDSRNPYDYTQDVPPPLKYVPYQPERRGLSPIPSVSGYTDTGSEHPAPLSRATHRTTDSIISERSLRQDGAMRSPASRRLVDDDDRSVRSSGVDGSVVSPAGSELDQAAPGQAVRAIGINPAFVHPLGIESNVASLVDGSLLEGSALTVDSEAIGNQRRESMATLEEENREYGDEREQTPRSESQRSRGFVEYDLDEYGRKVPQATYRQSPTASEAAITTAAVGAAADFLRRQNVQGKQAAQQEDEGSFQGAGVQRNRSFKERTQNGHRPGLDSNTNSIEQLANQQSNPKLGFTSLPDPHDPLPEIGDWHEDDLLTNPSLLDGDGGREEDEHWAEDATPRQNPQHLDDDDFHYEPLALAGAAGAAAGAAIGAAQNHSRQASQEHDEWYRSPEDKKRDTLVTNPYEGTSPIANLPGLNDSLLGGNNFDYGHDGYGTRSPRVDEGYISQGPNKTPDLQAQGKGVNFDVAPLGGPRGVVEDPFYTSNRHMSGMSQGMASPFYDAATGTGIERIESKDIIALMQHLMVRDAQRSARDTEILVTLVRSATELRNNFEDLKRILADTEDVIITEVKENTEKTVTRAINGPRPYPGSAPRSIQGVSVANTINEDIAAKKRSIFRRALKGLGTKGPNDLGRIEDMLNQLLTEVDVLKSQTAPGPHASNQDRQLYDNLDQEGQYEQDHGYEPEGHAGTSTASHASQSGYLSVHSRGTSVKPTYDRKVSAHRISTVPEDNEEDHGDDRDNASINYDVPETLMTPAIMNRGESVPLATPPQAIGQQPQGSLSNDNTPRTEDGKKKGRSSWFRIPKISRWSETTASSAPESTRLSKQSQKGEEIGYPVHPSQSGSLDHYSDNVYDIIPPGEPIQSDKLHSGFSEQDLPQSLHHQDESQGMYGQIPSPGPNNWVTMTPEDPKYKAHRDSLNLQHPQPRQGQTERFKAALESQALGFDSPMSPRSADWAGSATSLNRLPPNQNRENYGTPLDPTHYQQHWTSSPLAVNMTTTAGGPPRPPKEPLESQAQQYSSAVSPAPQNKRLSKLQKPAGPHQSVESGYGTMTHGAPTASYISQPGNTSPGPQGQQQVENRNLRGVVDQGINRRPSGPRPMTPTGTSGSGRNSGSVSAAGVGSPLSDDGSEGGRRKRGMI